MTTNILVEERYAKGNEIINYVRYKSKTGRGNDEVLQHKIHGTESAHITLHPDGAVNFRIGRTGDYLKNAISRNLVGFKPDISADVRLFLSKIRGKI